MRPRQIALAAIALAIAAGFAGALLTSGGSPPAITLPRVAPARPALALPRGALALAHQDGSRVIALSLEREAPRVRATVTVLAASGRGIGGLGVTVGDGARAAACGRGCYRVLLPQTAVSNAIRVRVNGPGARAASATFALPRSWPIAAQTTLERADRALHSARSVVYRDHLESAPGRAITTIWRVIAPDRLAYTVDNGSSGIVIGARRWDRDSASAPWRRSPQERLQLPALPWGSELQDVTLLDPPSGLTGKAVRVAMFDPATPAWYVITLASRSYRLRSVRMVAPSHFMRDDYLAYDSAPPIRPPEGAGAR